MVDKSSVLNFLNGYNLDEEDQTIPTVQEQQPVSSGVDSNSVLNFLNTQSPATYVQPNEDAVLTAPPKELGDTDWLVPVADDPTTTFIEPVYEYEKGERLAGVKDDIAQMDEYLDTLDAAEREEFEATVADSISSGNDMRDANFMDLTMSCRVLSTLSWQNPSYGYLKWSVLY